MNEPPKKTEVPEANKPMSKILIPLTKYAWDQEGNKVKYGFCYFKTIFHS